MLDQLTHNDFTPHIQSIFTIHYSDDAFLEAQLVSVDTIGERKPKASMRQAFSLVFHVNNGGMDFLPQKMYEIRHSHMGRFEPFLVPLGPDGTGFRYEAVFT